MAEISERPITPAQVRSIHVALSRLGIEDAEYRSLLGGRYGAASCKELTRRQASDFLTTLGRPLPNPPGGGPRRPRAKRRPKAPDNVTALASPLQRTLIGDLAKEVAWREEDGLARWLKANLGIDAVRTAEDASRAIEGLKAMARRQGR